MRRPTVTKPSKRTPAKRPAKPRKNAAAKPKVEDKSDAEPEDKDVEGKAEPDPTAGLVKPLRKESLSVLLSILDNASIKGSQARAILEIRRELYLVAGADING